MTVWMSHHLIIWRNFFTSKWLVTFSQIQIQFHFFSSLFSYPYIWFYLHVNLIILSNVVAVVAKHKCGSKLKLQVLSISDEELNVKQSDFPSDFLFGAATSAPQVHIENDLCPYIELIMIIHNIFVYYSWINAFLM